MERRLMLFWGGMILILALFIPITLLQDSVQADKSPVKRGGKRKWTPLDEPNPIKVRFTCMQRKKKAHGSLDRCQVVCPFPDPLSGAKQQKVLLRCFKGKWTALRVKKPRSLARRSVSLVEQQSASPEVLNNLLNHYFTHSHNYLDMAYFFDRADVQLPGFHHYFMGLWQGSVDRARSVMGYINKRGGWIDMKGLPSPTLSDTLAQGQRSGYVGLVAMETAVAMETESQRLVLSLVESVENSKQTDDPHLLHTLEERYLDVHVRQTRELMDYVTQLRMLQEAGQEDYSLGEYQMDSLLK